MNSWLIGGFAGLGLLVLFLTANNGAYSNLSHLTYSGDLGIGLIAALLLGVSGFSFYKGFQETNKKK